MEKMETIFCTLKSNKGYQDIVTSIRVAPSITPEERQKKALNQVCKKRSWKPEDIVKFGYTTIKYNKMSDDEWSGDMYETEHTVAVILKNGLPIAQAPSERQAKAVIRIMKENKENSAGIYKIYVVNRWVNEKKAMSGNYTLKDFEED